MTKIFKTHQPNSIKPKGRTIKQKQISNGRSLGLNTAAWKRLRAYQLNRQPICEHCFDDYGLTVPATDVDHIDNNPSNNDLSNLASLCKSCHSKKTNRDMGHKQSFGCDINGYPLDPSHEWNKAKNREKDLL